MRFLGDFLVLAGEVGFGGLAGGRVSGEGGLGDVGVAFDAKSKGGYVFGGRLGTSFILLHCTSLSFLQLPL